MDPKMPERLLKAPDRHASQDSKVDCFEPIFPNMATVSDFARRAVILSQGNIAIL